MKNLRRCFFSFLFLFAAVLTAADNIRDFAPAEFFPGHLQGIASDESGIYWSCHDCIIKTDWQGNKQLRVPSPKHAGDCTVKEGKLYVATGFRSVKLNQGSSGAVLIYDCKTLKCLQTVPLKETPHPDGIVWYKDCLYIANDDYGRKPHPECSVCIYDKDMKFMKKVSFKTGVLMNYGIQTLNLYKDRILAGFYSKPASFLLEPETFRVISPFPQRVELGFTMVPESVFNQPGVFCIGRLAGKKGKWFARAAFYQEKNGTIVPFPLHNINPKKKE